jgi:hypothetical protein
MEGIQGSDGRPVFCHLIAQEHDDSGCLVAYRDDLPSDTVTGDETYKEAISMRPREIEYKATSFTYQYEESEQQPW